MFSQFAAEKVSSHTKLQHNSNLYTLILAAFGIVFGDIGTSPLYTLQTVLDLSGGQPTAEVCLGLLSLIIWSLLIIVSLKYVTFVMRADNGGEGGILALMSLLRMRKHNRPIIVALGLFGASLIYGDGAITPAISVLSAIEGLKEASPDIAPFILPISVLVLFTLFAVQYNGTAKIGWIFGPVMIVWFLTLAALGIKGISLNTGVLAALDPWHAVYYLMTHGRTGFFVLGGVFLAVTGAEALYADMGHIGARPIRLAWYGLVLPALVLNYAGQTALVMKDPSIKENVFYHLCPSYLLLPMIGLATLATIIASQAIITGAFSMTRQAIHLGWCPRLDITQTSSEGYGQIYIGAVNWLLMIVTLTLTCTFGSSDRLAAAYGIAVSLTMLLTTSLLFVMTREVWRWKLPISLAVTGVFLFIDFTFFTANLLKVLEGGWVPLALAAGIYTLMFTWRRGTVTLTRNLRSMTIPVCDFIERLHQTGVPRVPGTAVFLSKTSEQTPPLVIWHVLNNRALHQYIVALSITITQSPWVDERERFTVEYLAPNFWRLVGHYGFMEKPDVPDLLKKAQAKGCEFDLSDVTYYVGHETVLHCVDGSGLPLWQQKLYALMQRNAAQINEYLNLPRGSVVEIGRQIEI